QCLYGCSWDIWDANGEDVTVNPVTLRAYGNLPRCPNCSQLARPNVLLFNDWRWQHTRSEAQERRLEGWLGDVLEKGGKIAVIEIGAGRAIPTVRLLSERVADAAAATLVRINPRDCVAPMRGVCASIPLGSLDALTRIAALL
ncbi:MAG: NAD-dependent deacetylase, partial [Fibrella sp.]|nr:NAD-dependent deacetylase [Armatimonadota bacterium]